MFCSLLKHLTFLLLAVATFFLPLQSSAMLSRESFAAGMCRNDPVNNSDALGMAPGDGGNPVTMGPGFDFYPRGGWSAGQFTFEQRTMSGFGAAWAVYEPVLVSFGTAGKVTMGVVLIVYDPSGLGKTYGALLVADAADQFQAYVRQEKAGLQKLYERAGWSEEAAGNIVFIKDMAELGLALGYCIPAATRPIAPTARPTASAKSVPAGSFSIVDWKGYPANLPKPAAPFRIIEGQEYTAARNAANQANRAMHQADASLAGKQIHEIKPVKFGGEPVNPINKIPLTPAEHAPATTWWNQLLRDLSGN